MPQEPLSPELVLVDPDLGIRARAALPDRVSTPARPLQRAAPVIASVEAAAPARAEGAHPYPLWARVTAALWLLVIGILIGGAAIPHAQDKPRVVPVGEDAPSAICEPTKTQPTLPTGPITPFGSP